MEPTSQHLPGVEGAIPALEEAAETYANIRDQRMALNAAEANLKTDVLRLMHEHGKRVYQRAGITITIVAEEESVKVRVKRTDDAPDTDADEDTAPNVVDFRSAAAGPDA
jgi:Tfp pilus assembly protein PilX